MPPSPTSARSVRRRERPAVALLALLLAAMLGSPLAEAARREAQPAHFEATVTNQAGEKLAGATITVTDDSGLRVTETTDKRGLFSLELPAGEYLLAVEKEGYAPFETRFKLEAGERQAGTIKLIDAEAGRRSEAVRAYNAGAEAWESGDRTAAKASFLAAIEADPTLPDPYRVLAAIYLDEKAWTEAATAAEQYLAARPGDRQGQILAYEAHRGLGDETRIVALRSDLGTDPELAPKLAVQAFNEGALAAQQGDSETAVARFREALELDPELVAAHLGLATVEYRQRRFAEALAAVVQALALEPDHLEARRLRFLVHDALGERQAAGEALEALIELDPRGGAALLYQQADLDFRQGEPERARVALLRVLELDPELARAHYTLGLVYASTDIALARQHLQRFLALAPDDPEAPAAKEILAALE